jgi:AmpD protein
MLQLDADQSWLIGVKRCPSPHCNERPEGTEIDLLVIHGISLPPGQFGGTYIDASFSTIASLKVSAHLLIRRDGAITQYVSFLKRAWHAGVSCFQNRTQCNDFSIGIELEGCDNIFYTQAQYHQLAKVIPILQHTWTQITPDHIVGHSDIAPGRKTDPGEAFDWDYLHKLLTENEQRT